MYLKSLEISGFKSFAKKGVLEFNVPISAIVGPNGSGKSNIAEAFRFVLGEQSIKSMRGKKGEDLIFNGSSEAGRSNRALVKVVFDNRDRFLNIDFDEVSVERVVHRDSVNEYYINGSQVRLKDVIELLSSAHIGASGHHIISQGEADRILNSNSKERKSMLEDALGLKIYQYKMQESERKLLKTEENIKSVESLRREIAPHIKFLKKQVEKIEQTMKMREELKDLYRDYFKRKEVYINYHRNRINEEKRGPQEKLEGVRQELERAKEVLSQSQERDEKSDQIMGLEEELREKRKEKDMLLVDLGRIEGEVGSAKRMLEKQAESLRSRGDKSIRFEEVCNLAGDIESKIDEGLVSDDPDFVKSILNQIREYIRNFISQNENREGESLNSDAEKEIESLLEEKRRLEERVSKSDEEVGYLNSKYHSIQKEIEESKDTGREAEREVFRLMTEENDLISKLTRLKDAEDKLIIEEEDYKRELGEAGVLVGRYVLEYGEVEPRSELGEVMSVEEIANEERSYQEERRKKIEKIKIRLEDSGIGSKDEIMKEYKETTERDEFLARELEDLERTADSLRSLMEELEDKLNNEFKQGIEKINSQFQEFFSLMFGGGNASLSVVKERKKKKRSDTDLSESDLADIPEEEEEESEEGVEVNVSLPRKKTKGLMMLSGGERALTSIALIFAVTQVNPPPFLILDETDAALDEANSVKYGNMIESLSKHSQLILITHNRETMSRAGTLFGITMGSSGSSKLLSIEFEEAMAVAKR